jgi:hypothetical protein
MTMGRTVALLATALALLVAAPARAGVLDDDPAIAAVGAGDMRIFVRGTDGAVWTRSWNGSSWSGWSSLGGVATSGPAAITRGNIYDVFVRGGDNAYYHKYFTPASGWSAGWERLGGVFHSAPGASLRDNSVIDVVGVGANQQLYQGYWTASTGWSKFGALGGGLSGRPSSVSPGPGILDIYMRGTDHQLYQKSWTNSGGWTDFARLGGSLTSGVSATSWDANRRDVFVRGPGNVPYVASYQAPNWTGFSAFDGQITSAPGAAALGPGRLALVARAGELIAIRTFAGSWTPWTNLGRAPLFTDPPPPPPTASELRLRAGLGCIPVGNRVPVRINVHKRAGHKKPRIVKVLFYVDRGKHKRTDRKKPYAARIRVAYKPGSKHRVRARIYYRRAGQKKIHRKTVSKHFTMCK